MTDPAPPLPPPAVDHVYTDRWGSRRVGPPPKADLEQRLAPYTLKTQTDPRCKETSGPYRCIHQRGHDGPHIAEGAAGLRIWGIWDFPEERPA